MLATVNGLILHLKPKSANELWVVNWLASHLQKKRRKKKKKVFLS